MNTFDILIYAIIAIILVAIFLALAQNYPTLESTSSLIKKSLEEARLDPNLGVTFLTGNLDYEKGTLLNASGLAPQGALLSIECTNPEYCCIRDSQKSQNQICEKNFEWDYDFIRVQQTKKINTFVRCIDLDQVNTCKVFIGSSPAQAQIEKIENIGENSNGNTEIKVTLTNSGHASLALGIATLKLYKKSNTQWIQTDYESNPKEIDIILPNEKKLLYWELTPTNLGQYRIMVKFEANNAGFSESTMDFNKTKNDFCKITNIGEVIYNATNDNYEELHNCEGCNYAYECANAWGEKNSQKIYFPKSKDYAYCIRLSANGSC
jgi:hypothetical protein